MHSYLRAIGFSDTFSSERDVSLFLDRVFNDFDHREVAKVDDDKAFLEMTKNVGPDMGICMCGEMDGYGFHRQYYFPYLKGGGITSEAEISIDHKINGQGYAVQAEDGRVGISIIFYLQNAARLKQESIGGTLAGKKITSTFVGLSLKGTILLPVKKQELTEEEVRVQNLKYEHQANLITQARQGNREAIEGLTMHEMESFEMVTRRLKNEDIYTIVETFFKPYGMETEIYQMMGTILFYRKVRNSYSGEYVYQMTLECNGMVFDVCINEKDLFGDPEVGRRFKGHIWLQGKLTFE